MGIISALKARIERTVSALERIADHSANNGQMTPLVDAIKQVSGQQDERMAQLVDVLAKAELQRVADNQVINENIIRLAEALGHAQVVNSQSLQHIRDVADYLKSSASQTEALYHATRRAELNNGTRRLSVVFFMQSAPVWPSWKTFWEACANDPRIEATMVLTPSCYPDRELGWLDDVRDFLIKEGIGFITAEAYQIERFKPDVAVLQFPYADTLPQHLQLSRLEAANVRTVYIPYGFETAKSGLTYRYQYDLPVQRTAWRVFVSSEQQKRMYARYCRSGSRHVVVAGNPKLDLITRNHAETVADEALKKKIAGRKTILWNPHFFVQDPPSWSTFDVFKDSMLDAMEARPELFFIIRPHPMLFARLLRDNFWTGNDEAAFRARIESMENCYLDEGSDYQIALALSDAMLTDVSSLLIEFFATGRPLLYLYNPEGWGLNEGADISESIYTASTINEVNAFLDMIRANEDPGKKKRQKAIPHFFNALDGHAGEHIRDYIYEEFLKTNDGILQDAMSPSQLPSSCHQQMSEEERADIELKLGKLLGSRNLVVSTALHIGCADGRLTKRIAPYARFTHGIDADPALIAQAQANAVSGEEKNRISFGVEYFDHLTSCGVYDLIVCLDVLSSVMNNQALIRHVDVLVAMLRKGAYLVAGDKLVHGQPRSQVENDHMIFYRNAQQYLTMFKRRGLSLVESVAGEHSDDAERHYYVFRKEQ